MFIGHFGVAFAAKRFAPKASLGTLLFAAQFVDLLWPILLLLGVERVAIVPGLMAVSPMDFQSYPISHSLAMAVVWGLVVGLAVLAFTRNTLSSIVSGALVVSHWLLDLVVHRPDLPLTPMSDTKVGFGLWNSALWTVIVEGAIFIAGVLVYTQTTRTRDRIGVWAWWTYLLVLIVMYLGALFGLPPPGWRPVAWLGLLGGLFVLWAWWIDKHRVIGSVSKES